jgi:hypothetical protein
MAIKFWMTQLLRCMGEIQIFATTEKAVDTKTEK